jgi:purine-binding chemotaxis protein CheW
MSTAQALVDQTAVAHGTTDQYLTFIVEKEEYGVDILRVQEIKGWDRVTPLPNTPSYVKGVINLRGTIVPIIDLRKRFALDEVPYGPTTVVIMLNVQSEQGQRIMGIVVDAVSEVYNVPTEDLKPAPDIGSGVGAEVVKGLATVENKMVILLDIDRLLGETSAV